MRCDLVRDLVRQKQSTHKVGPVQIGENWNSALAAIRPAVLQRVVANLGGYDQPRGICWAELLNNKKFTCRTELDTHTE